MKKLLFGMVVCLLFMGNVKALTFDKVVESYKEKVLSNEIFSEMFKDSSEKLTITNTDNSVTTHIDLTYLEVEDLTELNVIFNYKDGKLTYENNDELNNEIDESKYLLNSMLADLMYITIGDLNGYSEKQIQDTLTEEKTKSFTLDKNGIEFNLLKYTKTDQESGSGSFTAFFTKSFNLDINKFNIGEKRDHAVYLEFSEVVAQFKKDFANYELALELECELSNTENEIDISCSKNETSTKVVFKYSNNLLTYDLSLDEDPGSQMTEMIVSNLYAQLLLKSIATLNKYSDQEIVQALTDIYTKKVTLENNGIEFTEKNIHTEDNDGVVSVVGDVSGISNIKIDLTKFNLDNLIEETKNEESVIAEKCSEKDGNYYDKNGNSVSKEAYFESCGVVENPQTGLEIPLAILICSIILGGHLLLRNKNYFKKI